MKWKITSPDEFELYVSRKEAQILFGCVNEAAYSIMDVSEIPTRIGCTVEEVEALLAESGRLFGQANRSV
jgi:hypothetical protein